jgi:hypothetical protein
MNTASTTTPGKNGVDDYEKQQRRFSKWLTRLIGDVAEEMGISLTKIQFIDGRRLGCRDAHLLKIGSYGKLVSIIIHEGEFGMNEDPGHIELAKSKIRGVLAKLRNQAVHQ